MVGDQRRVLGRNPPADVERPAEPVGVLDRSGGLADPAHAGHRLHHRGARRVDRGREFGKKLLATGEPTHPRGYRPHPPNGPVGAGRSWPGKRRQCVLHSGFETARVGDRCRGQSAVDQPGPERLLPCSEPGVAKHRGRAVGVLPEEEHQPRDAPFLGGLVFQLGVGHLRAIPHGRPVPESHDQHIHVGLIDGLPTHRSRLVVLGREVGHIDHRVAGFRDGRFRRVYERAPRRELSQLRGVGQEHPPWRSIAGHNAQHAPFAQNDRFLDQPQAQEPHGQPNDVSGTRAAPHAQ
jgi:hypothetical protein